MATQTKITNYGTLTNPYLQTNVWGCKWIDGVVTYTFGTGETLQSQWIGKSGQNHPNGTAQSVAWSSFEQTAFRAATQLYSNVCNISFAESVQGALGNLVVYKVPETLVSGGLFEAPDGSNRAINTDAGFFNYQMKCWADLNPGGLGFVYLIHELGHGVGLAHPHDGGGNNRAYPGIAYGDRNADKDMGDNYLNQGIWTTMTYNDGWTKTATGADTGLTPPESQLFGYQATPMAFDVAALQFLYGANMQYHTGNDTYTLTKANALGTGWECIWDAGGIDTVTDAGSSIACTINLKAATLTNSPNGGGYVSLNAGIKGGFTIANNVVIENAIGGNAGDTLIGNTAMNALTGNSGNDALDGDLGIDTAIFSGARAQYQYNKGAGSVTDSVSTRDGTDTLISIERLKFADTMVGLDVGAGQNTGEVYRLYLSVLGRNPESDATGCGFWLDKLDRSILTAEQMVGSFLNSNEFIARFGSNTSTNDAFVNLLYQNLLGRDGHADAGFNFWLGVLDSNQANRSQVVVGFMESPENVTKAATLIGDTPTYQEWVG